MEVVYGKVAPCDTFPILDHPYFVKRDVIDSNWSVNIIRLYTTFPAIAEIESDQAWLQIEDKSSIKYKEDFTDTTQKTGVTYRHHESIKNTVFYTIANPQGKFYDNDKKYQFNYDWEENVKGKYELYSVIGLKLFRHKYLINRIMSLSKKIKSGDLKYSIDVKAEGKIEEYYANGKKKTVVEYVDWFLVEKKDDETAPVLTRKNRTGTRTTYYEKGKMFSTGAFTMSGPEGKVEYFNLKGEVIKVENYKNGLLNGKFQEFYDDGSPKTKGEYKDGVAVGDWQRFSKSGDKLD